MLFYKYDYKLLHLQENIQNYLFQTVNNVKFKMKNTNLVFCK